MQRERIGKASIGQDVRDPKLSRDFIGVILPLEIATISKLGSNCSTGMCPYFPQLPTPMIPNRIFPSLRTLI
jgi:hypothetical protein